MSNNEGPNSAKRAAVKSIFRFFLRLFKGRAAREPTLRETIEELIEDDSFAEASSIAEDEREMLENVLDLRNTQIQEIMVPRVEIVAMPVTTKIDSVMDLFMASKKSTIVVHQGALDNVVGIVHLKDVAGAAFSKKAFRLKPLVRDVLFVPPTMRTLDLLVNMRANGIKIAIIVDEYGDVGGLVSLQDLMEEIIGDTQDAAEAEHRKQRLTKASDGSLIVDAKTTFEEIRKYGGIEISSKNEQIETIGGLILSIAGHVPVRGEVISRQNLEFEILDADMRSIKKIKVRQNG